MPLNTTESFSSPLWALRPLLAVSHSHKHLNAITVGDVTTFWHETHFEAFHILRTWMSSSAAFNVTTNEVNYAW